MEVFNESLDHISRGKNSVADIKAKVEWIVMNYINIVKELNLINGEILNSS